jgi:hypothetical protein
VSGDWGFLSTLDLTEDLPQTVSSTQAGTLPTCRLLSLLPLARCATQCLACLRVSGDAG